MRYLIYEAKYRFGHILCKIGISACEIDGDRGAKIFGLGLQMKTDAIAKELEYLKDKRTQKKISND